MRRRVPQRAVSRLAAMPGRAQITLLACLCAAAIAGCGSDEEGTIPSQNSEQLISLLDAIERDVASGDCELAQDHAQEFVAGVNLLPADVDREVKGGLQEAAGRLAQLSTDTSQCETTGASGPEGVEPVEPTTEPAVTDTTSTTTTGDEQPPPEDTGDDSGQGPPQTPPGQGGTPPGQQNTGGDDGPTSGGIGGEKGSAR
jgi:hypothetical protein